MIAMDRPKPTGYFWCQNKPKVIDFPLPTSITY